MRIAFVVVVLLAACDDKKPAQRSEKTRESVVNAGLASTDGGMNEAAKSALVAQQCSLACQLHPEIDDCTTKCAKQCMTAADLAAVDACANGVAR